MRGRPHKRTDEKAAYQTGRCERGFTTVSGQVKLKMPKLKGMRFVAAGTERCESRGINVEDAIVEIHPAGAPARRVEDASGILWGAGASAGTASNFDDKAFKAVGERRCERRPANTRASTSTAST